MSLGTPVAGSVVTSSANGGAVSPGYPAGIVANDVVILVVGQKPSTANGGGVSPPAGWTLRGSLTAAGGYGTTLGADTGNTNLYIYTKDVVGAETGNINVSLSQNNITWAVIVCIPTFGGTSYNFATANGSQTTTPSTSLSVTLSSASIQAQTGDIFLSAFCIPTDVTTPFQFTNSQVTISGLTVTNLELREADTTAGNDIGGVVFASTVTAGSATGNPVFTSTLTGTLTDVRGPAVTVRIRDTTQSLTPSRYNNTNTFYSATISQSSPAETLTQTSTYNNNNTFYSQTLTRVPYALTQTSRLDNANTFYSAAIASSSVDLRPQKLINNNVLYSASVSRGAVNLAPSRYDNANTFYLLHVTQDAWVINQHTRLDNINAFYSPTISSSGLVISPYRYDNQSVFYSPFVTEGAQVIYQHERFDNSNAFYTLNLILGEYDLHQTERLDGVNQFYSAKIARTINPARFDSQAAFYSATIVRGTMQVAPPRTNNKNVIYSASISQQQFVNPSLFSNQNAFYDTNLAIEQFIDPSLASNSNAFYSVSVNATYFVAPQRVSDANNLYSASISVGPVSILPNIFANQNRFYKQSVLWWDGQPDTPETWADAPDTAAAWEAIPITVETWQQISDTETSWNSV